MPIDVMPGLGPALVHLFGRLPLAAGLAVAGLVAGTCLAACFSTAAAGSPDVHLGASRRQQGRRQRQRKSPR
jgi:hypothetical protein